MFIEITEKKIVIWDAGITVFAVLTLVFSCNTALALFILIAVCTEFVLWVNTLMEEMDAISLKSGCSVTQIFAILSSINTGCSSVDDSLWLLFFTA